MHRIIGFSPLSFPFWFKHVQVPYHGFLCISGLYDARSAWILFPFAFCMIPRSNFNCHVFWYCPKVYLYITWGGNDRKISRRIFLARYKSWARKIYKDFPLGDRDRCEKNHPRVAGIYVVTWRRSYFRELPTRLGVKPTNPLSGFN